MAHSPAVPVPNVDTLASETVSPAENAVVEATPAVAAARLDNPIERLDLSTPDTFIPESVDQLLAHSRRYPLLAPPRRLPWPSKSSAATCTPRNCSSTPTFVSSPPTRGATRTRDCRLPTSYRRACSD